MYVRSIRRFWKMENSPTHEKTSACICPQITPSKPIFLNNSNTLFFWGNTKPIQQTKCLIFQQSIRQSQLRLPVSQPVKQLSSLLTYLYLGGCLSASVIHPAPSIQTIQIVLLEEIKILRKENLQPSSTSPIVVQNQAPVSWSYNVGNRKLPSKVVG